jgi:hypothetical protein
MRRKELIHGLEGYENIWQQIGKDGDLCFLMIFHTWQGNIMWHGKHRRQIFLFLQG